MDRRSWTIPKWPACIWVGDCMRDGSPSRAVMGGVGWADYFVEAREVPEGWIPAFAGMTALV